MLDLTGQHVFIVGGSRGIGAAAALSAAGQGAAVTINYVSNASAAEAVCDKIRAAGGKCFAIQADASQEGALETAVDAATAELGPLTGIVVSAGIFEGLPIEEMTVDFWDKVMAINLRTTFLAVKAATARFRAAGKGGSIVIYTSTAGQRGSSVFSAYATSKGAQILFMKSMALELAADKIRVNCVAPAWTETDMAAPSLDSLGREKVAAGFPLGRIGLPTDIAAATTFLLSPEAAFITGSTITVDGGMDMRG